MVDTAHRGPQRILGTSGDSQRGHTRTYPDVHGRRNRYYQQDCSGDGRDDLRLMTDPGHGVRGRGEYPEGQVEFGGTFGGDRGAVREDALNVPRDGRMQTSRTAGTARDGGEPLPVKVGEMIRRVEAEGWVIKRRPS